MKTTLNPQYQTRPFSLNLAKETVDLFNANSMAIIGEKTESVDDMISEWQTPGFHPEEDALLVTTGDDQVVGYAEVYQLKPFVRLYNFGVVHPAHTGRGMGSFLLDWMEERSLEAVGKAPADARVVIAQGCNSRNTEAARLFEQRGYALVRKYYQMRKELDGQTPEVVLPEGVVIRPMRRGIDEEAVVRVVHESFQDHYGHVPEPFEAILERYLHRWNTMPDFDPALNLIAWHGDQAVGVAVNRRSAPEDPEMGWTNNLGVLREWRHKGVGLALLLASFGEFRRRGAKRAGLGVDAYSLTNAVRLYEKAGMHVHREFLGYEKELRAGVEYCTQALHGQE